MKILKNIGKPYYLQSVHILGTVLKVCRKGSRRVFVGAMKYFRYILMNHEIFFKIFRTNKLRDFDEGICFPDNCCYEMGKIYFYSDRSNGC